MRTLCVMTLAVGLATTPAFADRKIDEAVEKAHEQLQKGKPEDALRTMNKLVEQSPTAEAYLALGRFQEHMGSFDDAAASLNKAKQLGASAPAAVRADVLTALAAFDLRQGTGADALAHGRLAVEVAATSASLAVLARAQARTQDGAGALRTADQAVQAGPTSGAAHEARGEALRALGRSEDAVAAFRRALEADPKLNLARVRLAAALVEAGKAAEAVPEARKATEVDATSGEAFATLGAAILAQNPEAWGDAIAQAQMGAFLNPRSPLVQVAVGKIFESNGNFDQAVNAYRKALETDPGYSAARLALVQVLVTRGDVATALADAQRLATDMAGSGEAQLLLGRLLLRKNDYAAAATALERAATLSPGVAEAHALLGTSYQYTRRTEEAVAEYKKAVELASTNLQYRTTYGLLLGVLGQHEAGIAELQKVVNTRGYNESAAWDNLGWIYRNMTAAKTVESINAYKKALQINPRDEQAALGLGWAYSYTRAWDDSIAAFKKAIEIEPKTAGEANNGMAWCYFFKKDMAQAKAFMAKAQAAGRNDGRLAENIDRFEKMLAAGKVVTEEALAEAEHQRETERQRAQKIEAANDAVRSKNPGLRTKAARDLAALAGPDAVPALVYLLQDKDWNVKEAAAAALGSLGASARSAIPHLRAIINAPRNENLVMTKQEMQESLKDEDFRRSAKEALQKIERK